MGWYQSNFPKLQVIISYLLSDLIKKQRSFKIGLISIFLVVWFTTMLMNLISLNSLIFMRLVEDSVGEADFIFTPEVTREDVKSKDNFDTLIFNNEKPDSNYLSNKFIDFHDLQSRLKNLSIIEGVSPRWLLQGNTSNTYNNKTNWSVSNLLILDSDLEKKQSLGRKNNIHDLYEGECYVSSSLFSSLKLDFDNNTKVTIEVKLSALYRALNSLSDDGSNDAIGRMTNSINQHAMGGNGGQGKFSNDDDDSDILQEGDNENENEEKSFRSIAKKIFSFNSNLIDAKLIYDFFNVDELPNNEISYSIIDNPLFKNLPFANAVNILLNSVNSNSNSFLYKIADVDNKKKVIKFKPYEEIKDLKVAIDPSILLDFFTDKELDEMLSFKMTFKVKEHIPSNSGKWPSASGNVVAIDSKFMKIYMGKNIKRIENLISNKFESELFNQILTQISKKLIKNFDIYKYTISVNAVLKDKFSAYRNKGNDLTIYVYKQANKIMEALGYDYPITVTAPILASYSGIQYGQIMLVNIFRVIMVLLYIISILLVYSIMLGNVDERTYEFGLLRSMGFSKKSMIVLIMIQGFIFAVPGIILGFLTSYICNNFIGYLLNLYSGLAMPYFLSNYTIFFGAFIGITIVLFSSFVPIQKALDISLRETLTIFNKKMGDLVVNSIKLDRVGISPSATVSSVVLISIGISTFYIAPSSFFKLNPDLFIFIMLIILIVMILGLIVIVQVFMPKIQEFILSIIMFFAYKDKNLHFLVKKNLFGHQKRNKKVSIMFMVALSFVIFAGCTLNLVVEFISTFTKSTVGGDCSFYVTGHYSSLNQNALEDYMVKTKQKFPGLIKNYTWVSVPFHKLIELPYSFGALNGFPSIRRTIYAVDKNFIYSGYDDLYSISEYDKKLNYSYLEGSRKKVDIVSLLYKNDNVPPILPTNSLVNFPISPKAKKYRINMQLNVIIAEALRKSYALSTVNAASLKIRGYFYAQNIPCKIVGIARKLPGFPSYSSYSSIGLISPVLISQNQLKTLVRKELELYGFLNYSYSKHTGIKHSKDGLPKNWMFIKFKENANSTLRYMIYSEVKNIFDKDGALSIIIDDIIQTANKARKIMGYIFLVIGIIALIMSFFLIWTSFYSNIKDNICEYGIMRAIGLDQDKSTRMFLYEAATIIISSIITGTAIGVMVSVTLILQFNIFVELPFIFKFPKLMYFVLVVVGMGLGMMGSYYPVAEVNKLSLIKIMKGFNG